MDVNEEEYTALYDAIADRGEELVVDPESFVEATYAPNYLPLLGRTRRRRAGPRARTSAKRGSWRRSSARRRGSSRTTSKSAKESWHRACFVPAHADFDDFAAICERLLEIRGDRFERGFVVKKYLELATLPGWTPERRRVTDEHRLVFWEGRLVAHAPYYDVEAALEDPALLAFLGRIIGSPFFTADVARLASGGYTVIEINDGGCSTLPEQMDPRALYRAILR